MSWYRIELGPGLSISGGAVHTAAIYATEPGANGLKKGKRVGVLVADTEVEVVANLGKFVEQEGSMAAVIEAMKKAE